MILPVMQELDSDAYAATDAEQDYNSESEVKMTDDVLQQHMYLETLRFTAKRRQNKRRRAGSDIAAR